MDFVRNNSDTATVLSRIVLFADEIDLASFHALVATILEDWYVTLTDERIEASFLSHRFEISLAGLPPREVSTRVGGDPSTITAAFLLQATDFESEAAAWFMCRLAVGRQSGQWFDGSRLLAIDTISEAQLPYDITRTPSELWQRISIGLYGSQPFTPAQIWSVLAKISDALVIHDEAALPLEWSIADDLYTLEIEIAQNVEDGPGDIHQIADLLGATPTSCVIFTAHGLHAYATAADLARWVDAEQRLAWWGDGGNAIVHGGAIRFLDVASAPEIVLQFADHIDEWTVGAALAGVESERVLDPWSRPAWTVNLPAGKVHIARVHDGAVASLCEAGAISRLDDGSCPQTLLELSQTQTVSSAALDEVLVMLQGLGTHRTIRTATE